ncbi:MAG: PAS domain S-box protein [Cyanobacteria bacterium RI_101]|nr:PAS domain S-box protein [Cyanobacteria bacterium RI_101]
MLNSPTVNLDWAIAVRPLITASPETPTLEVLGLLHQARRSTCSLGERESELEIIPSCAFVMAGEELAGIVTERDFVRLAAAGTDITPEQSIREIMSHPVHSLKKSQLTDAFQVAALLRERRIRHLPILDDEGKLLGCITENSLRRVLRSVDLLRLRRVGEMMDCSPVAAPAEVSILEIAQRMSDGQTSAVIIGEPLAGNPQRYRAQGLITERDLLQFQALGLDFRRFQAREAMSAPLMTIGTEESLERAYYQMQRRNIQRLGVVGEDGGLEGLLTQASILQILDPAEMYGVMEILQEKVRRLEREKVEILTSRNQQLESLLQKQTRQIETQFQQERILNEIALKIRQNLDLDQTLTTAVAEIKTFFAVDRCLVYQFEETNYRGQIVAEAVGAGWTHGLGQKIEDTCFDEGLNERYLRGDCWALSDIETAGLTDCHQQLLKQFQVRANLVVPIIIQTLAAEFDPCPQVWGLLILHQCSAPRIWQPQKIDFLKKLADQLAIAVQQSGALARAVQEIQERQAIADNLRQKETMLREAQQLARLGVWEFHPATGRVSWSPEVFAIFGLDPTRQVTYDQMSPYFHPESQALRQRLVSRALELGEPYAADFKIIRNDGSTGHIFSKGQPVFDQAGRVVSLQGILMDITERQEAVELSERLQERLSLVIKGSNDGWWDYDVTAGELYIAPRWWQMLGYGEGELKSDLETWRSFIHPEDLEGVNRAFEAVLAPGGVDSVELEYRLRHREGHYISVLSRGYTLRDAQGLAIRNCGTNTDLTPLKQKETALQVALDQLHRLNEELESRVRQRTQALEDSESRFRAIIDSVSDGIIVLDAQGDILFANPVAVVMFRRSLEELIGLQLGVPLIQGRAFDLNIHRANGEMGVAECLVAPIHWQGEEASILCLRDATERKEIEERYAQENRFRRQIVESMVEGLCVCRAIETFPHVEFVVWNPQMETITGYKIEEINAQGWYQSLYPDPDYQRRARERMERMRQGDNLQSETWHITRKTGEKRIVSISTAAIFDPKGKVNILAVIQDITERQRMETDLRLSEERFRRYFEQSLIGMAITGPNKEWIDANARLSEILGYSLEELKRLTWAEMTHPEDVDADVAFFNQVLAGEREGYEMDKRFIHKDGHIIYAQISVQCLRREDGSLDFFVAMVQDISDRKQMEETLRWSEARYRSLMEQAGDAILLADLEGNIIEANQRAAELFGYSKEEFARLHFTALHSPEKLELYRGYFQEILEKGSGAYADVEIIRKDGAVVPADLSSSIIDWGDRRISQGIFRDASQRKEAERQLQASYEQLALSNRQLERASRLKDEFLANMSHELRTPLNAVLGMGQALDEEVLGPLTPKQKKAVSTINSSGRHLLTLINDILDLSKIEAGKLELDLAPVHLQEMCQLCLQFVKQQAFKKRIALSSQLPPQTLYFQGDERRLRQALINLLNNAVKFTPDGGQVSLTVALNLEAKPPSLDFEVRDTGIGISQEDQKKLFQPFVQIDSKLSRQYEGTGLGLALVKRLTELHGGRVSLTSEPGQGSRFTLSIPYVGVNSPASPEPMPTPESQPFAEPPYLLLVEDNVDNVASLKDYLEYKGYRLGVAYNGQEALDSIAQETPDLILMDVQMPVLDGVEATRQIRANPDWGSIPIIALTALTMPGDRERFLAAGMNDHISKPVHLRALMTLINQFLGSNP